MKTLTAKKVADVLVDTLVAAGVKNIYVNLTVEHKNLTKPGIEKIP